MSTRNIIIGCVALLFLIIKLRQDFSRDEGLHKRAKAYHATILCVLVFFDSTSLYYFFWVLFHFETVASGYTTYVGYVPGSVQFGLYLFKLLCTVTVFVLCFFMAARKEKVRKVFFYALPLLCLSGLLNFYTNALAFGNGFDMAFPNLIRISAVVYVGLTLFTLMIYKSPFMKAFFHYTDLPDDNDDENILDDINISDES